MPWAAGTYTKWNGSGGWAADAAANIGIEAGRHDTQDADFQDGINACLNKDGSNSATGNLNLGNNKLINVANGSATADAVTYGQVQAGVNIQSTAVNYTLSQFSADATAGQITFTKSYGATVGTNTLVPASTYLGQLNFQGANGTGYTTGAQILAATDNTPGASNDMPTALLFLTTADGSGSPTERLRISSSGYFGFGNSSPGVFLDLARTANDTLTRIRLSNSNSGSSAATYFQLGNDANVSAASIFIQSSANTTGAGANSLNITNGLAAPIRMKAGSSGGVQLDSGATSWSAVSDARFKKNVEPLEYGLTQIQQLNPVRFDYLDDSTNTSARIGFIAQDVDMVIPEAISGNAASQLFLSPTELIPALVNAVKELSVTVNTLQNRITALEA